MRKRWRAIGTCAVILAVMSAASVALAQRTTVKGIAYSTYEIVADSGDVYEVVADEKGSELAGMDGMRVSASGMLEVDGGRMILQVMSFSVLDGDFQDMGAMVEEEPLETEPPANDEYLFEEEPLPGEEPYLDEEPLLEEERFLDEESISGREYLGGEPPEDMLPE